jgi:hypothetical protein
MYLTTLRNASELFRCMCLTRHKDDLAKPVTVIVNYPPFVVSKHRQSEMGLCYLSSHHSWRVKIEPVAPRVVGKVRGMNY